MRILPISLFSIFFYDFRFCWLCCLATDLDNGSYAFDGEIVWFGEIFKSNSVQHIRMTTTNLVDNVCLMIWMIVVGCLPIEFELHWFQDFRRLRPKIVSKMTFGMAAVVGTMFLYNYCFCFSPSNVRFHQAETKYGCPHCIVVSPSVSTNRPVCLPWFCVYPDKKKTVMGFWRQGSP